jgi:hypothetical protein
MGSDYDSWKTRTPDDDAPAPHEDDEGPTELELLHASVISSARRFGKYLGQEMLSELRRSDAWCVEPESLEPLALKAFTLALAKTLRGDQ